MVFFIQLLKNIHQCVVDLCMYHLLQAKLLIVQLNTPSLSLDTIVKGIEAACKAIAENSEDIVAVEGHTH